jgi:hypothetical protein
MQRHTLLTLGIEELEDRCLLTTLGWNLYKNVLIPGGGPVRGLALTPPAVKSYYGFDQIQFQSGNQTIPGDGRGQTIAIVDFDPQHILGWDTVTDLGTFDQAFGLVPMDGLNGHPTLTMYDQQSDGSFLPVTETHNTPPPSPTGNQPHLEINADVQWAHAIAPMANIIVVGSDTSSYYPTILPAVQWAASQPGVSVVSMSFGFRQDLGAPEDIHQFDGDLTQPGVTFVASSGDKPFWTDNTGMRHAIIQYPAVLPNVLSVGGTLVNGLNSAEHVWNDAIGASAGGVSTFTPMPSYQQTVNLSGVSSQPLQPVGRVVPDVAYRAGYFAVVDSYDYGTWDNNDQNMATHGPWVWCVGTSAGTPQWAGLISIANQGRALELPDRGPLNSLDPTLPMIYSLPTSDFRDITQGGNGLYNATAGIDPVTGRGSPNANLVVRDLVAPFHGYYAMVLNNSLTIYGNQNAGSDQITLSPHGNNLVVTDNTLSDQFAVGSFTSIELHTRNLVDTVNVQSTAGMPLTIYLGDGTVTVNRSPTGTPITIQAGESSEQVNVVESVGTLDSLGGLFTINGNGHTSVTLDDSPVQAAAVSFPFVQPNGSVAYGAVSIQPGPAAYSLSAAAPFPFDVGELDLTRTTKTLTTENLPNQPTIRSVAQDQAVFHLSNLASLTVKDGKEVDDVHDGSLPIDTIAVTSTVGIDSTTLDVTSAGAQITVGYANNSLDQIGTVILDARKSPGGVKAVLDDEAADRPFYFDGVTTTYQSNPSYTITYQTVQRVNQGTDTISGNGFTGNPQPFGPNTMNLTYYNLQSLNLAGGPTGNVFDVRSTAAATPVKIFTGGGKNTTVVGGDGTSTYTFVGLVPSAQANTMDMIQSLVTVHGQGQDTLVLNDQATTSYSNSDAAGNALSYSPKPTFALTAGNVTRDNKVSLSLTLNGVTLPGVQDNQAEVDYDGSIGSLEVHGGSSGNTFNVQSAVTITPVTIYAGRGSDSVNVGNPTDPTQPTTTSTLAGIQGLLTVHGKGNTSLNVNDQGNGSYQEYEVFADHILWGLHTTPSWLTHIKYDGLANLTLDGGSGPYYFYFLAGTAPGTTTVVNGHSGEDDFIVGDTSGLDNIRGPLQLHARPEAVYSLVSVTDWLNTAHHTYRLTSPSASTNEIERFEMQGNRDMAPITYEGADEEIFYAPKAGGQVINLESNAGTASGKFTAGIFTFLSTGAGDIVNVGRPNPNGAGRLLDQVQGQVSIGYSGYGAPTVNIDDSGDTTARQATFDTSSYAY